MTQLDAATLAKVQAMTERKLQEEVRRMCNERGYLVQHIEDSLGGRVWVTGWPDLEVIGRSGIIYRELKDQRTWTTGNQVIVGAAIIHAGGNWSTWRPADLFNGRIERELDAIA